MTVPMDSHRRDVVLIRAPRSLGVLAFQTVLGLPLIALAAIFLLGATISWAHLTLQDRLMLLTITLPCSVFGVLLIYLPQRYIPRVLITLRGNRLKRMRNHQVVQEHDLGAITHLVSRRIKTTPGMSYQLTLHTSDGHTAVLFDEDAMFGGRHWQQFAECLSTAAGKPLTTEFWSERYNGKLVLIPQERLTVALRRGLLVLSVPIAVSSIAAVISSVLRTNQSFLVLGCGSVLANLMISFYYAFSHRQEFREASHTVILVAAVLTLGVPYLIFYAFFVFLLKGIQILIRI